MVVGAWGLHHGGEALHGLGGQEGAHPLAELALEHVRVPVAVRPERRGRVVDMQRSEAVEPDPLLHLLEDAAEGLRLPDLDPRHVEMARVEADPQPRMALEGVEDDGELVDRAADRAAGAGRVLEQEPRRLGAAVEHLAERGQRALQARLEAGAEMGADVDDDSVRFDRARGVDCRAHGLDALAVDHLVRRRQVAEVESMDEHRADPALASPLPEPREIFLRMLWISPGARALREELDRVRSDLDRSVEGALDP